MIELYLLVFFNVEKGFDLRVLVISEVLVMLLKVFGVWEYIVVMCVKFYIGFSVWDDLVYWIDFIV